MHEDLFNFLVVPDTLDEFLGKEPNQTDNEELYYERYLVNKDKTDLISSLNALDKKYLKKN